MLLLVTGSLWPVFVWHLYSVRFWHHLPGRNVLILAGLCSETPILPLFWTCTLLDCVLWLLSALNPAGFVCFFVCFSHRFCNAHLFQLQLIIRSFRVDLLKLPTTQREPLIHSPGSFLFLFYLFKESFLILFSLSALLLKLLKWNQVTCGLR